MAKIVYQQGGEGREHLYEGGSKTGSVGSGSGGPTTILKENNRLLFYTLVGLSIYYLGV